MLSKSFEKLKNRRPGFISAGKAANYAVTVPLVEEGGVPYVLFEKRAASLDRQPGEICLPGGERNMEETAMENAVRETAEELCVSRAQIIPIAQMDSLLMNGGGQVDVFLCELKDYKNTWSKAEVDYVFTVPLSFFLETEPDTYVNTMSQRFAEGFPFDKIPLGKNYPWHVPKYTVYFYYYEDKVIWGLTANIIRSTANILKEAGARREIL